MRRAILGRIGCPGLLLGALLFYPPSAPAQDVCDELQAEIGSELEFLVTEFFAAIELAFQEFSFDQRECERVCKKAVAGCRKVAKDLTRLTKDLENTVSSVAKIGCGTLDRDDKRACSLGVRAVDRELRECLKLIDQDLRFACESEQPACELLCSP